MVATFNKHLEAADPFDRQFLAETSGSVAAAEEEAARFAEAVARVEVQVFNQVRVHVHVCVCVFACVCTRVHASVHVCVEGEL